MATIDYVEVTPQEGDNPAENKWYEKVSGVYVRTKDTTVVSGKKYYAAYTVKESGDVAKFKPKREALEKASTGDAVKEALLDALAYCNTLHSKRFGTTAKN